MLSRITACWLAVLVLVPFTAPFRTVDLAVLFGGSRAHHVPADPAGPSTLTSESNLARVPALSRVGRVRFVPLSGVSASAPANVAHSGGRLRAAFFLTGVRGADMLATILRL
jgi:hypothetical protein